MEGLARRFTLAIVVLALVAGVSACGEGDDPSEDGDVVAERIETFVGGMGAEWGEAFAFHGFVGVYEDGVPLYEHAYGTVDGASQARADSDTVFRIGSLTKPITAVAIMQLVERGELGLDDPVSEHLPAYPHPELEIHHLLSHTGGVPNYTLDPGLSSVRDEPRTTEELVALLATVPLDFPPGEKYAYSNGGYMLLGAVIEAVSGSAYGDFVDTSIAKPAGMTRTRYGAPQDVATDDVARGYTLDSHDAVTDAFPIHYSFAHAAGGISSTARDLVAFDAALRDGTLLAPDSVEQLYVVVQQDYAFGWEISETAGHRIASHGGSIDGFLSSFGRAVDSGVVVVAWSNNDLVPAAPVGVAGMSAYYDVPITPFVETPVADIAAAIIAELTGSYTLTEASKKHLEELGLPAAVIDTVASAEVTSTEDGLFFTPAGQPGFRLYPRSEDSFFAKGKDIGADFGHADDGTTIATVKVAEVELELARDE